MFVLNIDLSLLSELENIISSDGTLIGFQTGFGIYSLFDEIYYKLKQPCSIYVAEMNAINFACQQIENYFPAK